MTIIGGVSSFLKKRRIMQENDLCPGSVDLQSARPVIHRLAIPASPRILRAMTETEAADLKAMQDDIYRERILRARSQTVEDRLADVFEQSNFQFRMMHAGAMDKIRTQDEAEGWQEVRRWMQRLDRVHDHGLYVTAKPAAA